MHPSLLASAHGAQDSALAALIARHSPTRSLSFLPPDRMRCKDPLEARQPLPDFLDRWSVRGLPPSGAGRAAAPGRRSTQRSRPGPVASWRPAVRCGPEQGVSCRRVCRPEFWRRVFTAWGRVEELPRRCHSEPSPAPVLATGAAAAPPPPVPAVLPRADPVGSRLGRGTDESASF